MVLVLMRFQMQKDKHVNVLKNKLWKTRKNVKSYWQLIKLLQIFFTMNSYI